MTLQDYFDLPNALPRTALCEALGISNGRLSQLRDFVDWPPELALRFEEVTGGAVSASRLSPIIAQARAA